MGVKILFFNSLQIYEIALYIQKKSGDFFSPDFSVLFHSKKNR